MFKRFSPELQAKNLARRDERMKAHEDFLSNLKELSKSDKNIWIAQAEAQEKSRQEELRRQAEGQAAQDRMRQEMRAQAQGR